MSLENTKDLIGKERNDLIIYIGDLFSILWLTYPLTLNQAF
jgi:hypothetical protein